LMGIEKVLIVVARGKAPKQSHKREKRLLLLPRKDRNENGGELKIPEWECRGFYLNFWGIPNTRNYRLV
jgi:hypothetical protein